MITGTAQRALTAAALMMSASLVLAACGTDGSGSDIDDNEAGDIAHAKNDDGPSPAGVYQFDEAKTEGYTDQELFTSTGEPVTVQLSDELAAALPDGRSVPVDHYTIEATAIDRETCRVDVGISFADGGEDAILGSDYFEDDDLPAHKIVSSLADDTIYHEDYIVDEVPDDTSIEPDEVYITSDFTTISYAGECSEDADSGYLLYLQFPYTDEVSSTFARVKVAVADSGGEATTALLGDTEAALNVTEGKWEQSSQG